MSMLERRNHEYTHTGGTVRRLLMAGAKPKEFMIDLVTVKRRPLEFREKTYGKKNDIPLANQELTYDIKKKTTTQLIDAY